MSANPVVRRAVFFSLLLAATGSSESARADASEPADARLGLLGGLAIGGEQEVEVDTAIGTAQFPDDLDPTPVLALRYESPIASYFLFGGQFGLARHAVDSDADRHTWLDFTLLPSFAIAFDLGAVTLEPRLSVPVGFSLDILSGDARDGADAFGVNPTQPGLNVGVTAGLTVWFGDRFGALLEFGFVHHVAYAQGDNESDWRLRQNQALLQAGFSLRL